MERYNLSITTGGLFILETVTLLRAYHDSGSWEKVLERVTEENLLQKTHIRSAMNVYNDVRRRIESAYGWEMKALVNTEDPEERGFVCMAFTSRRYRILRDAVVDVVNYKWQGGDRILEPYEIPKFIESLIPEHPELERISARTREDLAQILKRDMRDGGLLVKEMGRIFRIKKPGISIKMENRYRNEGSADDLRLMLYSEAEIRSIKRNS